MTFERIAQGRAASPVSSTTAAEVSSHDVSMPRIDHSKMRFSDSMYGGRQMPRSVMMPAMKRCGVTSNAGFQTQRAVGRELRCP